MCSPRDIKIATYRIFNDFYVSAHRLKACIHEASQEFKTLCVAIVNVLGTEDAILEERDIMIEVMDVFKQMRRVQNDCRIWQDENVWICGCEDDWMDGLKAAGIDDEKGRRIKLYMMDLYESIWSFEKRYGDILRIVEGSYDEDSGEYREWFNPIVDMNRLIEHGAR
ncbi:hypothetical protein K504DRAFT_520825 [Pleomassaria siparia CBS 279.74]|uniref:Uncharacterized protein n=1 Tax=Pleomassaria siparia CBS 279.74 TaxID=1314801 RepID=A0A6G1JR29_9PLEO|nr:hypothetical protein K504DRAFT_520825 [Pleomassaria siparia CBS 279.74]